MCAIKLTRHSIGVSILSLVLAPHNVDVIVSDVTLFNNHKISVDISIHHGCHVEYYFEFTIGKVDRRIAVSAGFHHAEISQMGF